MLKFLLLGLFLCQQPISDVCGQTHSVGGDTDAPSLLKLFGPTDAVSRTISITASANFVNAFKAVPGVAGLHNYIMNQTVYINNLHVTYPSKFDSGNSTIATNVDEVVSSVRTVMNESKTFKVHNLTLTWNEARILCIKKGGHLAILRTYEEVAEVRLLLRQASINFVWIGFHDWFDEGEWLSVLDEPLVKFKWDAWWKLRKANPDDANGEKHCAAFNGEEGLLYDENCSKSIPFVCEITTRNCTVL